MSGHRNRRQKRSEHLRTIKEEYSENQSPATYPYQGEHVAAPHRFGRRSVHVGRSAGEEPAFECLEDKNVCDEST